MRAYCGGTFDILHPGHLKLFRWAKQTFGHLTVSLNTDAFILRYKNRLPAMNFSERFDLLSELRCVDNVVENIGDEDSKPAILLAQSTHIVNGSDWTRERLMKQMRLSDGFLKENGIEMVIFPHSLPLHSSHLRGLYGS